MLGGDDVWLANKDDSTNLVRILAPTADICRLVVVVANSHKYLYKRFNDFSISGFNDWFTKFDV